MHLGSTRGPEDLESAYLSRRRPLPLSQGAPCPASFTAGHNQCFSHTWARQRDSASQSSEKAKLLGPEASTSTSTEVERSAPSVASAKKAGVFPPHSQTPGIWDSRERESQPLPFPPPIPPPRPLTPLGEV